MNNTCMETHIVVAGVPNKLKPQWKEMVEEDTEFVDSFLGLALRSDEKSVRAIVLTSEFCFINMGHMPSIISFLAERPLMTLLIVGEKTTKNDTQGRAVMAL